MTDSHVSTANYAAVIADLRAKRDELNRTIAMLEAMANLNSSPARAEAPKAHDPVPSSLPQGLGQGQKGANTGIGEACAQILREHGDSMSTREVTTALAEQGFSLTMANPTNNVWSALSHRSRTKGDVARDNGRWYYTGQTRKSSLADKLNADDTSWAGYAPNAGV